MVNYNELSKDELLSELKKNEEAYDKIKAQNLKLDMSRGKPESGQLDLSMDMMDIMSSKADFVTKLGTDTRNYGDIDGIREAKILMATVMGVSDPMSVIVFGNASLSIMYDLVSRAYTHGIMGNTPWHKLDEVKFLCPVPGYDRHFKITEHFGCNMIPIPMDEHGPDMDMVEKYVNNDESVKGIWCVPKYSNPSGISYSDEVVMRFVGLEPKAKDFRIYWDNAYNLHHLYDEEDRQDKILNLLDELKKAGKEDMVYQLGSTSKISMAGSGIAALAASPANIKEILDTMIIRTICYDKINQLRHARYFDTDEKVYEKMREHAHILRPKFEKSQEVLSEELEGLGVGTWTKPRGGYFITFVGLDGTATEIVRLCKEAGMVMTGAGAPFPYGKDPKDSTIRIAPSYPKVSELEIAMRLFCLCVKIVTLKLLIEKK